ncbi:hypothetical protein DL769_010108 [Monosporascus sp. CRB-8-3]|nr:hypothetical protein DL769_010108 [Monosporascus sp. CRB-8-3]
MPDYLRLSLICMTLNHRINRTRGDPHYGRLVKTFYQYRGIMIRSLSDDINVEHKRTSNAVIAGIMTLLLTDVQQGTIPDWRCHLEGIQKVIMLRGGIHALAESQNLKQLVLYFVVITVIGNTTSPATDLVMTSSCLEQLNFILKQDSGRSFPSDMCPVPLFAEIIKINHLRMRATNCIPASQEALSQEAYQILDVIDTFSPGQWADSKPSSKQDWILVGNVYRAAVAIYCISSLQCLSLLPPLRGSLRSKCAAHGQALQALLDEALACPRIKRFMLWPLVCLGVEAAHENAAMRTFVAQQLSEMSRHVGTYVPLTAKAVLERFWASGETRWDACFYRPYAFATQIAIDISQVLPLC